MASLLRSTSCEQLDDKGQEPFVPSMKLVMSALSEHDTE